ncbi:MAG: hypothetical protein M1281_06215 [Chloroflexi bacterium]|nr:hypothetical protein [Chloroflexota bacterium]
MNTTNQNQVSEADTSRRPRGWIAGGILILIGVMSLLQQIVDMSYLIFLPGLGLIFLAWGLLARKTGLLIPGGVLAGLGLGTYLIESPFLVLGEPAKGGVILLSMAAGWGLISLLSLFTEGAGKWVAWPLIPGGILALLGGIMMAGEPGLQVMEYVGKGWPVVLIAIGLYLILRRRDATES